MGLDARYMFYRAISRILPYRFITKLYSWQGARIGEGSVVAGYISKPKNLVLGNGSKIGKQAYLDTRADRYVTLDDGSLIGERSEIHAGLSVGRNSIILPDSKVEKYTKVPDNEIWGGRPVESLQRLEGQKMPKELLTLKWFIRNQLQIRYNIKDVRDDEPLYDKGILTKRLLLAFIAHLEKELSIRLPNKRPKPAGLQSVDDLADAFLLLLSQKPEDEKMIRSNRALIRRFNIKDKVKVKQTSSVAIAAVFLLLFLSTMSVDDKVQFKEQLIKNSRYDRNFLMSSGIEYGVNQSVPLDLQEFQQIDLYIRDRPRKVKLEFSEPNDIGIDFRKSGSSSLRQTDEISLYDQRKKLNLPYAFKTRFHESYEFEEAVATLTFDDVSKSMGLKDAAVEGEGRQDISVNIELERESRIKTAIVELEIGQGGLSNEITGLFSYDPGSKTYTCKNCSDCNAAIAEASAGDTIRLVNDTISKDSHCIDLRNKNEITFDCDGHEIRFEGTSARYGVYLYLSSWDTVKNCNIIDFYKGIVNDESYFNTFENMHVRDCLNGYFGDQDKGAVIRDSVFEYNSDGVYEEHSFDEENPILIDNVISRNNQRAGFVFEHSRYIDVLGSKALDNGQHGVWSWDSYDISFSGFEASGNGACGFHFNDNGENVLDDLVVKNNAESGICLIDASHDNVIKDSHLEGNTDYGIFFAEDFLTFPSRNLVYNNYFLEDDPIGHEGGPPEPYTGWDNDMRNSLSVELDCSSGPNIIGGDCIGGNFWSNSAGTGFSEECTNDGQGICAEDNDLVFALDREPLTDNPQPDIGDLECDSCSDCTSKIQSASAGDMVTLISDIAITDGHCIDFGGKDGITLDCQNHDIIFESRDEWHGIYLYGANDNTIKNCNVMNSIESLSITDYNAGIYNYESYYNTFDNIHVRDCYWGYRGYEDSGAVIRDSIFEYNYGCGVFEQHSDQEGSPVLIDNVISRNNKAGFRIMHTEYVDVQNSKALSNSGDGVYSQDGYHISYANFESSDNGGNGLRFVDNVFNVLDNMVIKNNGKTGIYLLSTSHSSMIRNSHIEGNTDYGIYFMGTETTNKFFPAKNQIHNNHFVQDDPIGYEGGPPYPYTDWDNDKRNNFSIEPACSGGSNIIGGDCIGGNYWANSAGTGFSETCTDDGNGICTEDYDFVFALDREPLTDNPETGPGDVECDSCEDCTSKIASASSGDAIKLAADITSSSGDCIDIDTKEGITFDCEGHKITGSGDVNTKGINIIDTTNAAVKDCTLEDFSYEMYVESSSNIELSGLKLDLGGVLYDSGILIYDSTNIDIIDMEGTAHGTGLESFYIVWIVSSDDVTVRDSEFMYHGSERDIMRVADSLDVDFFNNMLSTDGTAFYLRVDTLSEVDMSPALDCASGPNIVGGGCIGGNYYALSDESGQTGYSEDCTDSDGNGICDEAYDMSISRWVDDYPLTLAADVQTECGSCSDCSAKLSSAGSGDKVILSQDITASGSHCIDVEGKEGITFDCNGHSITGSDTDGAYGISIVDTSNSVFENCRIEDFDKGIYLDNNVGTYNKGSPVSAGNTVRDMEITGCDAYMREYEDSSCGLLIEGTQANALENIDSHDNRFGVIMYAAHFNTLVDSEFKDNLHDGIFMDASNENIIKRTASTFNSRMGMYVERSDNNTFSKIIVSDNEERGLDIYRSQENVFNEIDLLTNGIGIYAHGSDLNKVKDNIFSGLKVKDNDCGLHLQYPTESNEFYSCEIADNQHGLRFSGGISDHQNKDNVFADNYFSNEQNVVCDYYGNNCTIGLNLFSVDAQVKETIIGTYNYGGNFWGRPDGTGYSQTCIDSDNNSVCDEPYLVFGDAENYDHLPLKGDSQARPIAPCLNGIKDGDETDVDCGGSCPACVLGRNCSLNTDCQSMFCNQTSMKCENISINMCSDGILNQDETDVDCGGVCDPCSLNMSCRQGIDCHSGLCINNTCSLPLDCKNSYQDVNETDIDCGGVCQPCGLHKYCVVNRDCKSNYCRQGMCEPEPDCSNGYQDGDETDIDCGGSCSKCEEGRLCLDDDDCASGRCNNTCYALDDSDTTKASCSDGVLNGDETDIDCGGSCEPCKGKRESLTIRIGDKRKTYSYAPGERTQIDFRDLLEQHLKECRTDRCSVRIRISAHGPIAVQELKLDYSIPSSAKVIIDGKTYPSGRIRLPVSPADGELAFILDSDTMDTLIISDMLIRYSVDKDTIDIAPNVHENCVDYPCKVGMSLTSRKRENIDLKGVGVE